MADSYVCSGAVMRCTFGTSTAKLRVLPDRTVWLAGQRMANIMDHKSMANIPGFGRCRTVTYPATGAATAAHHGHLTPMPCIPGTLTPWMPGKTDYLIQGPPALLKSCKCMCQWGGVITITDDGQHGEGTQWVNKAQRQPFFSNNSNNKQNDSLGVSALNASGEKQLSQETLKKLVSIEFSKPPKVAFEKLDQKEQEEIKGMCDEEYAIRALENSKMLDAHEIAMIKSMINEGQFSDFVKQVKEERKNIAFQFYKEQGMAHNDILSHLSGIDINHPVSVVDIPPPDELFQLCCGDRVGDYFTDNERDLGSPNGVGKIYGEWIEIDGEKVYVTANRVPKKFSRNHVPPSRKIQALKSTSAKRVDDWSISVESDIVESESESSRVCLDPQDDTTGGGTQYYIGKKQKDAFLSIYSVNDVHSTIPT